MKYTAKLDRHRYIFKKILNNENINSSELSSRLGVNIKTVERDLKEELSAIFKSPFKYQNGTWEIPEFVIDTSSYSEDDLSVINALLLETKKNDNELYKKGVLLFERLGQNSS